MSGSNEIDRVRALVEPIASDLDLDLYDIERRGSTLRVTLDTQPGSPAGITLDSLALATRLISREIDHDDPIPSRFTLEVTSPGLERQLRTPAHFQREVGKKITVRFRDPDAHPRRIDGVLVAADGDTVTLRLDDDTETTFAHEAVDKARAVFEWGPAPKPGGPKPGASKKGAQESRAPKNSAAAASGSKKHTKSGSARTGTSTTREKQTS